MRRIANIINHWSASGPGTTVSMIRGWHTAQGWRDVGYHRIILHPDCPEFKKRPTQWWELVKTGRQLNDDLFLEAKEVGAHTLGYNSTSVGICTIGKPGLPLDPLQKLAITQTNLIFVARFQLTRKVVWGHRNFNATACPGDEIYKVVQEIRQGEHKLAA